MTNVLYFEGAGMEFYEDITKKLSDVGNFRIRSSFLNNEGVQFYIEMGNTNKFDKKGKGKTLEKMGMWVDFCFKIPNDKNDEVKYHEIFSKTNEHLELAKMDYTKENIAKWINEKLNCNFDTIEVLDSFYGYYVHGDNRTYNRMEDIELIHNRAIARKEAYNSVDIEYRTLLNEKYSMIGLLEMDNESITIKCHASDQALGNNERIKRIPVIY
ncbi:hypothetical protein [Psychrobacillus phage Perkons]|nr:hypothetical protein [Psychrobacillus phage Perkons]